MSRISTVYIHIFDGMMMKGHIKPEGYNVQEEQE